MRITARRIATTALAGSLTALLTACGGDDRTAEEAEETVEEYVAEFSDGDGDDACDLLTEDAAEDLVDEWTESGFGDGEEDCEEVIEAGAIFLDAFTEDGLEIADISSELDGDEATVTVEYEDDLTAEVYTLVHDGEWLIDGQEEVGEEEAEDFEESEDVEPEPSETTTTSAEPSAIGELGSVGDWEVRVTEVDEDATDLLTKPKYYNSAPAGQYVLVTFEATYVGDDRSADTLFDLTWTLTTADQQVHEASGATTPADDESWPTEARSGGTITGQAVFDVDPAQLAGALVTVESYDDEGGEEYVDFAL